jgi:hypothetical protein
MKNKGVTVPVIDSCQVGFDEPTTAGVFYGLGVAAQIVGNFMAALTGKYACSALSGVQCAAVLFHTELRKEIRTKAQIPTHWCTNHCGDCCEDFCCALFCTSCALTQEQKQLDAFDDALPPNTMQNNELKGLLNPQGRP